VQYICICFDKQACKQAVNQPINQSINHHFYGGEQEPSKEAVATQMILSVSVNRTFRKPLQLYLKVDPTMNIWPNFTLVQNRESNLVLEYIPGASGLMDGQSFNFKTKQDIQAFTEEFTWSLDTAGIGMLDAPQFLAISPTMPGAFPGPKDNDTLGTPKEDDPNGEKDISMHCNFISI